MSNVTIHPAAEREYEDALKDYFGASPQAATQFEAAFSRAIESIGFDPSSVPAIDGICRSVLVFDHPYSLIYCLNQGKPWVVAVAHLKHLPASWEERD